MNGFRGIAPRPPLHSPRLPDPLSRPPAHKNAGKRIDSLAGERFSTMKLYPPKPEDTTEKPSERAELAAAEAEQDALQAERDRLKRQCLEAVAPINDRLHELAEEIEHLCCNSDSWPDDARKVRP